MDRSSHEAPRRRIARCDKSVFLRYHPVWLCTRRHGWNGQPGRRAPWPGNHFSKNGVAPRTAQVAMRHSSLEDTTETGMMMGGPAALVR